MTPHDILSTLIGVLLAIVISVTATHSPRNTTHPTAEHYHYCEKTEVINQASNGSPLIDDCLQITKNIDEDEWARKWWSCGQHAIVSAGSCVFGIETVPNNICYPFTTLEIGNGDIIDFIEASIERFGWEGRVGTMGYSRCHNVGRWRDDYLKVKWGVYHS